MKKSFKFWGIILYLFLMIPTANALTQEQAREKILAEDIVVANLHSMDYSYTVGTKLNDRMNNLGIGGHIAMKGCTYTTCSFTVSYYDYETSSQITFDVDDFAIKKYGLVFENDDKALVISWNNVSNATKYEVYRATSKTGKYTKVATIEEGLYKDSALTYGTTYYYKVRAYATVNDKKVYSGYSALKNIIMMELIL